MYINYGDVNFFEYGVLVDSEHSDTEFQILYCLPYPDREDIYLFAHLVVDINDTWIDQAAIESFADVKKETDPIQYAIACVEYYGCDSFGSYSPRFGYGFGSMTRTEIESELKDYLIASDNLDVTW